MFNILIVKKKVNTCVVTILLEALDNGGQHFVSKLICTTTQTPLSPFLSSCYDVENRCDSELPWGNPPSVWLVLCVCLDCHILFWQKPLIAYLL